MKKLILIIIFFSTHCYSQINYQKGYFIHNNGQKTECWIKNNDWKNNPTKFKYKLSENSEQLKTTIKQVKEFNIYGHSKYIRTNVNIDRSSKNIDHLSSDRNPIFKKEQLFLKVLIEGKANLYAYFDDNLRRYFYKKENLEIEQLVYKIYKVEQLKTKKNYKFRQQLWMNLKCPDIKENNYKHINYTKKDLVKFFTSYNNCYNIKANNFERKKRTSFNLTLRPRINVSSLKMIESIPFNSLETDYGTTTNLGFGIEAEFILPFNNDKWSIIIEPTYQYFKYSELTLANNGLIEEINYNSIEIPVGLRHYFHLNKNSKLFINASFITDFNLNSSIKFTREDGSTLNSLEVESNHNLAFGFGYKFNKKYSLEMRYQTNRDILERYKSISTEYKTLSIIFGYSLL